MQVSCRSGHNNSDPGVGISDEQQTRREHLLRMHFRVHSYTYTHTLGLARGRNFRDEFLQSKRGIRNKNSGFENMSPICITRRLSLSVDAEIIGWGIRLRVCVWYLAYYHVPDIYIYGTSSSCIPAVGGVSFFVFI